MDNGRFKNFIFSNAIMKEKCEEKLKAAIKDGNFSNICSVCLRQLRMKQKGIPCKQCHSLIHRKCAKLNHYTLKSIGEDINSWNCSTCRSLQFPFMNQTDSEMIWLTFHSNYDCICKEFSHENTLESKTNNDLIEKINLPKLKLNEYSGDHSTDVDEQIDLKCNFDYYSVHEFHRLKNNTSLRNSFGVFHANISSLSANFEKLELLLYEMNFKFDIIALTETWNSETRKHLFNLGLLLGYHRYESLTGNSMKSGCGFYIAKNVPYKPRTDLDSQYHDEFSEFHANWVEIINRKGKNTIVGVIYRHPRKSDTQFQIYLNETFNKIRNENKLMTRVGDFNYNLLNHETDTQVNDFIQIMLSNFCQPHIIQSTRIVDNAKPSLVDNIFFNSIKYGTKSGNITSKISDHLPNFIILEKLDFRTTKVIKIQRRDFTKFNPQKFIVGIKRLDLSNTVKQHNNANGSCDVFMIFLSNLSTSMPQLKPYPKTN